MPGDVADDEVNVAVNNMLKAITASLLMEQVLAPNFKFKPKFPGDVDEPGTIKIKGYKEPSEKVKNIIESDGNFFSYEVIQKYNLKIFLNSTLGLESLAIGEKSYSIPLGCHKKHVNKFRSEKKVEKFGFPLKLPEQGYCWDNDFVYSRVEQKLVHLFNLKYSRWNRIHNKKKKFMSYDKKNKKLKNILKKFKIYI